METKETVVNVDEAPVETRRKTRRDEEWTENHESLVYEWQQKCKNASEAHNAAGKKCKTNHIIFGLPAIIIPIIFSPLSVALEDEKALPYVSMAGFILAGTFSAIDKFFSYDAKKTSHFNTSARYDDLVTDIKYEMVKGYEFRESSDAFLQKIQSKFDNINGTAPDI